MNEQIQTEINNILSNVRQPSRKQYPPAKHQIKSLTELGLIDYMKSGFGYTDAAAVIEAAQDAPGAVLDANFEGSEVGGSKLWKLLNAKPEPTSDEPKPKFQKDQMVRVTETGQQVKIQGRMKGRWITTGGSFDEAELEEIAVMNEEIVKSVPTAKVEKFIDNGLEVFSGNWLYVASYYLDESGSYYHLSGGEEFERPRESFSFETVDELAAAMREIADLRKWRKVEPTY